MDPDLTLIDLLNALDGIPQHPRHHPEGDALYHSLQVFEHATRASRDPELWAAALLHDVGKAIDVRGHAEMGAELLTDVVSPRVVWLVRHHMHLAYHPHRTRRRFRNDPRLRDLERLRRWDLAGRSPYANVLYDPDMAVSMLHHTPALPGLWPGNAHDTEIDR